MREVARSNNNNTGSAQMDRLLHVAEAALQEAEGAAQPPAAAQPQQQQPQQLPWRALQRMHL